MKNIEEKVISRALDEIQNDYLEEYGDPETMTEEDKKAAAKNLLYIASKWQREGNQLMAGGLTSLAAKYDCI